MSHNHYFRDVSGLEKIDVYRLLDLFGVTCPVAQRVVKKAIAAGQRGHKTLRNDWLDIADSAARKLQMIDEDNGWTPAAIKDAAFLRTTHGEVRPFDPSVSPKAEDFGGDWPNESRRTEQQETAEDKAWREIEERMDVIGTNGNDGEHYPLIAGCTACFGKGRVDGVYGHTECPACKGDSRE
jgi:hypothetical protein